MSRTRSVSRAALPVLLTLASFAANAQQLQRPATPAAPSPLPTTETPRPSLPTDASQRAYPAMPVPPKGPAAVRTLEPAPTVARPKPKTSSQIRDAQGRIIPGAQATQPGRARDPATGQEFQAAPVIRPH